MSDVDWGAQKGIADEPHFDRFVAKYGGKRICDMFPNAQFKNADYFFQADGVIAELKILENEFAESAG